VRLFGILGIARTTEEKEAYVVGVRTRRAPRNDCAWYWSEGWILRSEERFGGGETHGLKVDQRTA
jgi:hypothetical protein